jgi:hypothetical protein
MNLNSTLTPHITGSMSRQGQRANSKLPETEESWADKDEIDDMPLARHDRKPKRAAGNSMTALSVSKCQLKTVLKLHTERQMPLPAKKTRGGWL